MAELPLSRRAFIVASTGAALALGLAAPAARSLERAPFGRYGSPSARLTGQTLYVHPGGLGDHTTVQAAVNAASGGGRTLVIAPGTYRETVAVGIDRTEMTWIGASENPRDVVIVYDNANGTPKPGGGTYGTTGSATTTVQADGFTARWITFANDWLRAEHPEITGTQAVAIKVQGDRSAFEHCRFLGHQDTLYADSMALGTVARQYFAHCYIEGDVDFVFGRATAVYEHCHFHTLNRTDLATAPYGFVFAPSTAVANPRGYLVTRSRVTSGAPDAYYKLARPWVPGSDTTARPMLTVRDTRLDAGIDAVAPYTNMSDTYPWQSQRFAEYRNTGPGAEIGVPANRPQLTDEQAEFATREEYLGDWAPWRGRTLQVRPGGSVQAAVDAVTGPGWTIVVHPGIYREVVNIPASKGNLTIRGASRDPRAAVIVYDNANGTPKPDGSGTYGTAGSATFTSAAPGLTVRELTIANDWLRADHPEITGTQAVAAYVTGDRSHFSQVRLLAHQDTLFADTTALNAFDRQYYRDCYIEGDVDFVFGRATAVFERCHFHTLDRDVTFRPEGMVFAPSTARANPYGFLAVGCRITSGAEDGAYKIARPWVPSYETTAWPSLVVRETRLGAGIDAVTPYINMREAYPWQTMRFREYRNTGPGAEITVPENRPQLTDAEADAHTRAAYLGDWRP